MLLAERAPGAVDLPRDEALGELAARFFAGHGPATVKDLAWWASLTQAEVRAGIARAGDRLRREEAGGLELWSAGGPGDDIASDVGRMASPIVHLIQGYDEYIMGYADTRWLLARQGSSWAPATPPVGRLVILLDGCVGGFWRRTLEKRRVLVEAGADRRVGLRRASCAAGGGRAVRSLPRSARRAGGRALSLRFLFRRRSHSCAARHCRVSS